MRKYGKIGDMERQNPFAREMFWKRMLGFGLILGGAAIALVMLNPGNEVVNGVDAAIWLAAGLAAVAGLGLIFSEDPAKL